MSDREKLPEPGRLRSKSDSEANDGPTPLETPLSTSLPSRPSINNAANPPGTAAAAPVAFDVNTPASTTSGETDYLGYIDTDTQTSTLSSNVVTPTEEEPGSVFVNHSFKPDDSIAFRLSDSTAPRLTPTGAARRPRSNSARKRPYGGPNRESATHWLTVGGTGSRPRSDSEVTNPYAVAEWERPNNNICIVCGRTDIAFPPYCGVCQMAEWNNAKTKGNRSNAMNDSEPAPVNSENDAHCDRSNSVNDSPPPALDGANSNLSNALSDSEPGPTGSENHTHTSPSNQLNERELPSQAASDNNDPNISSTEASSGSGPAWAANKDWYRGPDGVWHEGSGRRV